MTAVTVPYSSLKSQTIPLSTLESAFGPSSLGIIIISDLPPSYPSLRSRALNFSNTLAHLPPSTLSALERPSAKYSIGWSRGKENLGTGYDELKGSFYFHPVQNAALQTKARDLYPDREEMVSPNIWPASLPGFEESLMTLSNLIVDVAAEVAKACDRFGQENIEGYRPKLVEEWVRGSVATKARLLHYYPSGGEEWCGSHKDLGALTGLTAQMWVDESLCHQGEEEARELDAHPNDPTAGLWIVDRGGRHVHVDIPRDCLAFQTGEALERVTKGRFKAVPHYVTAGKGGGQIARNTLAVFTQPNLWENVDGVTFADLATERLKGTL
ncbi:Clavaminate synthase-like protein [Piedraia hortae CBS 480.64]|uniref:Clavaminate synthase-like protein n=1 Tax=Piedraia hortae CBS 480.64 TaxID=1314780 RepID=A0A6A7BPX5_9PEZI|nr:Clavaminate synthase-like protein [Piedraia hortae CBS 480.64]